MTKRRSSKSQTSNRHSTPSRFPRTARINEVLREIIAEYLERRSDKDERLHMVTITEIDTDPGLEHAKVYYSALAASSTEEEIAAALADSRKELQSLIGRSVKMKRTPLLIFVHDQSLVEGQKIEAILRDINSGQ